MDRRRFLATMTGAAAGALATAGCGGLAAGMGESTSATPTSEPVTPSVAPPTTMAPPRSPAPTTALTTLPGDAPRILLGVDDGISAQAIRDWCHFATEYDQRLVFFANGCYPSWEEVRPTLAPLVESGRVQLANHTHDHPKLPLCSDAEIARQMSENATKFRRLYGVDLKPWYRPPYGMHDARVDAVMAAEGYHPAVDWADSFADWNPTSTDYYVQRADACFQSGYVVLAHANKTDLAPAFPALAAMIRERGLRTVTLDDVFES